MAAYIFPHFDAILGFLALVVIVAALLFPKNQPHLSLVTIPVKVRRY